MQIANLAEEQSGRCRQSDRRDLPDPAYMATLVVIGIALPAALGLVAVTGMHLVTASVTPLVVAVLMLAATHFHYRRRTDPIVHLTTGGTAMLIAACLLAGIISHVGLRLRRPMIDPWLAFADDRLGLQTDWMLDLMLRHPGWALLLNLSYASALPAVFSTLLFLGVTRNERRLWKLCFVFAASILTTSIIGTIAPAIGSIASHHPAGLPGAPEGAGVFYLPAYWYFYSGVDPSVDIGMFTGVVTFPSFHMVMALLVPYALRHHRLLGSIAAGWAILVAASTISIGGHYAVDLIGGAACFGLMRHFCRERPGRAPRA